MSLWVLSGPMNCNVGFVSRLFFKVHRAQHDPRADIRGDAETEKYGLVQDVRGRKHEGPFTG